MRKNNKWLQISIDGIPFQRLSHTQFKPNQLWGFQSGQNNVSIHDIRITTQNGQQHTENFTPPCPYTNP